MNKQALFAALKATAVAAMSVAGLTLSACDERPYPESHSAPPPAAPPAADLMGAPSTPYAAPPVYQQPAYAPPPVYAASPYDPGSIVAMAPIPNPGDAGSAPYYDQRYYSGRRVHARYEANTPTQTADNAVTAPYGEGHPASGHHPVYAYPATHSTPAAPQQAASESKATTVAASADRSANNARVTSPTADHASTVGSKTAAVAATAGAAVGLLARDAKHAVASAVPAATSAGAGKAAQPSGDRTANLASLQTALTDAVGKTAVLTEPARFTADQPADVSLTLPAGFGDTLKSAAQKNGLGDAAASVNITAILSGDGFAVTPDDTQSVSLTPGQPAEFHWTVIAHSGAKGPLHADVGADLLGGGGSEKLALGSVQPGAHASLGARALGITLLVLLAGLILIWAVTRRRPVAVVRERPGARPLDMVADD